MQRSGFSLASLLLLTAVVAILLAALRSAALRPGFNNDGTTSLMITGSALVGTFVGAVCGARQSRWFAGTMLGGLAGVLSGIGAGGLLTSPSSLAIAAVGSAVLILFGVIVRRHSDGPPRGY
jgi:hypothetical protein